MSDTLTTRDRILEAAIQIIETHGESSLRVEKVVELAGFTKPVLYHHFANRDSLITEAHTERYRRSMDMGLIEMRADLPNLKTREEFADRLASWLKFFASPQARDRRVMRSEVLGVATTRPELQESVNRANRDFVESVANMLRVARDNQWIRIDFTPEALAAWWMALVHGRHFMEVDPDYFDLESWDAITLLSVQFLLGNG